jgi:hypothetical protein
MCVIVFHIAVNECSIRDVMLHVSGKLMHIISVITHFVFWKLISLCVIACFKEESLYGYNLFYIHSICQSLVVTYYAGLHKSRARNHD